MRNDVFNPHPTNGFVWLDVAVAEVLYTYMLGFVGFTPSGHGASRSFGAMRDDVSGRVCFVVLCSQRALALA